MSVERMEHPEDIRDVAHLAHVEILTPKPDETVDFFTRLLGLSRSGQSGQSAYLRAWGDHYQHSLKVTESPKPGLGHVSWRAVSDKALEQRAKALAATEFGKGWIEGDTGHGRAFQFVDPDGHLMELFFDVEKSRSPGESAPLLKNRLSKIPLNGVPATRIDHVNLMTSDVSAGRKFLQRRLGFKHREGVIHRNHELGAWMSVTPLVHDLAYMYDPSGRHGRLHHVAYWLDSQDALSRAADILREYEVPIEAGPGRHAITGALFLYCYEPGGNRVELFTGGYLIFDPDWEPVIWTEEEKDLRLWWGGTLPESFHTYGTPAA